MKSWVLTDTAKNVYVEQLTVKPADIGPSIAGQFEIQKRRLSGGQQDGVDVIDVSNGRIRFTVLPTRGMGLHQVWAGPNRPIGWRSPVVGPVHPSLVNLADHSGLGWLDGFDEFLCRCGLESNGAPEFNEQGQIKFPLHGRISNQPAHRVELAYDTTAGEIIITGVVHELRFHFQKLRLTSTIRTKPGEWGLRIRDEVTNIGETPAGMQVLYHVNFGTELLDAGAQVVAPVHTLVPRTDHAAASVKEWNHYRGPQAGFAEQVYFLKLAEDANGQTQTLIKNAHGTLAASLLYNPKQLPCFTIWKDTGALADGYVTGLEPGTNYPNPRSFEEKQKRVVELKPGETQTIDLALQIHPDAASIKAAEAKIAAIQKSVAPQIHTTPQPGWCAGV